MQDGQTLITSGSDNIIRILSLSTMKVKYQFPNKHFTPINKVIIDKDAKWIITFSEDEINLRTLLTNKDVISFRNIYNAETVFFDDDKMLIYYINSITRTLETLSINVLNGIYN